MKYEEPLFRPPAEAGSLIFQVAYGCPHNRCRFCGMYKTVRYRLRNRAEVLAEIAGAGKAWPDTRRVFLADGDVMALPSNLLGEYLEAINAAFPHLARINLYANMEGGTSSGEADTDKEPTGEEPEPETPEEPTDPSEPTDPEQPGGGDDSGTPGEI